MENKKIVFYSLVNGAGSTTIGYQVARLLRIPFYQEQQNDLVFLLESILDSDKYTVKQLEDYDIEDSNWGGVFDLKSLNHRLFKNADAIIVLTNNSYLDVLKTIATLQKIESILKNSSKPIHVIFNRLQSGNADREKRYTNVSKDLILNNAPKLNIQFSYIRNNLVYYRNINKGKFFMDSFFKWNKNLLKKYESLLNTPPLKHLEMFFDYQYEKIPYDFKDIIEYEYFYNDIQVDKYTNGKSCDINEKIAKLNFHQENIRLSRVAIRDMYSLLYKLGNIYTKEYEINKITKQRKKIEEN